MPVLTSDVAKRPVRWQLSHTQPAPLALDHPVQDDLAAAADEIERLRAALKVIAECTDPEDNKTSSEPPHKLARVYFESMRSVARAALAGEQSAPDK